MSVKENPFDALKMWEEVQLTFKKSGPLDKYETSTLPLRRDDVTLPVFATIGLPP